MEMHLNPVPALHFIFEFLRTSRPAQQLPVCRCCKSTCSILSRFVQTDGFRQGGALDVRTNGRCARPLQCEQRTRSRGNSSNPRTSNSPDGQELNDSRGEALGSLKLSVKIPGRKRCRGIWRRIAGFPATNCGIPEVETRRGGSLLKLCSGKYAILVGSQTKPYSVVRTSSQAAIPPATT